MQNINYINHLNRVLDQFLKDDRLNPTHISMYMALFKFWNYLHFPESFHINREEIMKLSKIGSKSTYHRVIKELNHWKYIVYIPSKNPFKGSVVKLFNFGTSTKHPKVPLNPKSDPTSGQALVSKYKRNKTLINRGNEQNKKHPQNEDEVIMFFKNENASKTDALKFFNHYKATGWKMGNQTQIENWQALARKWILKTTELEAERTNKKSQSQNQDNLKTIDHLHTNRIKNYHQPL